MQYLTVNEWQGLLASFFLFILGWLCWMIYRNFAPFIRFEQQTTQFFQQRFGNPQMSYSDGWLNSILTFLATYGSAPFISVTTCIIAVFLLMNGDRSLAVWLLGVVSTGGIFGIFLKKIFQRNRPNEHLAFDTGHSFPSGHAIASTLFFLALLLVFLPIVQSIGIRIIAAVLIYLVWGGILFSRLYFHAHHLGDLLAGISLGIFWVLTAMGVYNIVIDIFYQYFLK